MRAVNRLAMMVFAIVLAAGMVTARPDVSDAAYQCVTGAKACLHFIVPADGTTRYYGYVTVPYYPGGGYANIRDDGKLATVKWMRNKTLSGDFIAFGAGPCRSRKQDSQTWVAVTPYFNAYVHAYVPAGQGPAYGCAAT